MTFTHILDLDVTDDEHWYTIIYGITMRGVESFYRVNLPNGELFSLYVF